MENKTYWVLAYGESASEENKGQVTKFDSFTEADEYAVKMNKGSELLYSITQNPETVETYCLAYKLEYSKFK
jgi:fibronectin type 3 domain-containing protein